MSNFQDALARVVDRVAKEQPTYVKKYGAREWWKWTNWPTTWDRPWKSGGRNELYGWDRELDTRFHTRRYGRTIQRLLREEVSQEDQHGRLVMPEVGLDGQELY